MNTKQIVSIFFASLIAMFMLVSCATEQDEREAANEQVIEELQEFVDATERRIEVFGQNVGDETETTVEEIEESIERQKRKLEDNYDDFSDKTRNKADEISDKLDNLKEKIQTKVENAKKDVKETLNQDNS